MTVGELIQKLQQVDPERIVIVQADSEGNGYSPLAGIDDNALYEADTTWSGSVGLQTVTSGYTEEDVGTGEPCLVLYPVN